MKNRNIVVHSDKITKGRSKLNLQEMKAFLATVTTIDPKNDTEFKEVTLTRQEFCSDTNLYNDYRNVKSICQKLLKQVYEIEHIDEGKRIYQGFTIYQRFIYDEKKQEVRFKFNDDMRPYLLELTKKFTKYQIKNIINMTSKYSIRTYQLLKDLRDVKRHIEFELEDFCDKLEVPKSKRKWGDFQLDIMQTAIKEINELTDIRILGIFPERKRGKKVLSFSLKFCYADEYEDVKNIDDEDTLIEIGKSIGLDENDMRERYGKGEFQTEVKGNFLKAGNLGINYVPIFIIDEKASVVGVKNPDAFKKAISAVINLIKERE